MTKIKRTRVILDAALGLVSLNVKDRLYVLACGKGYTCLGFEVCEQWTRDYATALGREDLMPLTGDVGTVAGYRAYTAASEALRVSGTTCLAHLTPELAGLEGKRVEVIDNSGDKRRFYVGKSTGWAPIHLEVPLRTSSGGIGVYGTPFRSVRVIPIYDDRMANR